MFRSCCRLLAAKKSVLDGEEAPRKIRAPAMTNDGRASNTRTIFGRATSLARLVTNFLGHRHRPGSSPSNTRALLRL